MPGTWQPRIWASDPSIHAPARHKRACAYEVFLPAELASLEVHLDGTIAGAVSEAEHAIQGLNASPWPALAPLARLLLHTESIASSRVEGLQLDAGELARAEAKAETGMRISGTAREVLANVDAMDLAITEAATVERFGRQEVLDIHRRLMEQSPTPNIAGTVRTKQNWIGGNDYTPCGADFVPPPPDDVDRLLDELCVAINDKVLPPLVQAALVHAQFETIHPFDDGNGRTGRALIHVVLRRRGLSPSYIPPISVVLAQAKSRYIDGLTRFRSNDPEGISSWIAHFADAAGRAAGLAQHYLGEVTALQARWREQVSQSPALRSDAAAWAIIDVLPAHPVITAPVAIAATGRARSRIYQAIEQLVRAGVLIPLGTSRRNQAWEAAGLLEVVAALESGTFA